MDYLKEPTEEEKLSIELLERIRDHKSMLKRLHFVAAEARKMNDLNLLIQANDRIADEEKGLFEASLQHRLLHRRAFRRLEEEVKQHGYR